MPGLERSHGGGVAAERFVKAATGPAAGEQIRREADLLEAARHPGVVELIGIDEQSGRPALVTSRVAGPSLADAPALALGEAVGVLAGVASTVADLHDMGIVHGALAPEHVLLAPDGRAVLCGFGHGGRVGRTPVTAPVLPDGFADPARPPTGPLLPSSDVFALGALVTRLVSVSAPGGAGRTLLRLRALSARATAADPGRRPTARELAAAIAAAMPGATVAKEPKWRLPRVGLAGIGLVIAAVVAVLLGARLIAASPDRTASPSPRATVGDPLPSPAPTASTPATAPAAGPDAGRSCDGDAGLLSADIDGDGCAEALRYADGVLEGAGARWAGGLAGDQPATGDWACLGSHTLALLRPATGEVFVFDGWAEPGRDLVGALAGRVDGGFALRTADLDGDGCPELVVERQGRPPASIPLPSGP